MLVVALGVADEAFDEAEDVRLALDVGDGVVVEGSAEVYGVEGLYLISQVFEHPSHIVDERAFGVGHEVVRVCLEEVGLHIIARLACSGPSYHEHVVVRLRLLVMGVVYEAYCRVLGEDDVVVGILRISIGRHLLESCPAGRSVLLSLAVASSPLPPSHPNEPYGAGKRRAYRKR